MVAFNDTEKERFQEVEIKGHYGLFTDSRMNGPRDYHTKSVQLLSCV